MYLVRQQRIILLALQSVVVLDPDLSKDYLDRIQNRTKEKRYNFDHAFGPECTNLVYINLFFNLVSLFPCIFYHFVSKITQLFDKQHCIFWMA